MDALIAFGALGLYAVASMVTACLLMRCHLEREGTCRYFPLRPKKGCAQWHNHYGLPKCWRKPERTIGTAFWMLFAGQFWPLLLVTVIPALVVLHKTPLSPREQTERNEAKERELEELMEKLQREQDSWERSKLEGAKDSPAPALADSWRKQLLGFGR